VLEPVRLGGVTIRKATLHNFEDIQRKDIRVGDTVILRRAGDVIPYIVGPVPAKRPPGAKVYELPQVCPSCGGPVVTSEDEVAVYCNNVACPEQRVRSAWHFAMAMDVEGLGERTIKLLVEHGLIDDAADLYGLKDRREELLSLEGFADKSVDNLLAAIEATKERPLGQVLRALGIRGVGGSITQVLTQRYCSLDELAAAGQEELEAIEGLGPHTAGAIVEWFGRPRNREFVGKLLEAGVKLEQEAPAAPVVGALSGLAFVITGTLPSMSRDEASKLIQQHGGKVAGGVSRNTDYLVVGESPGGSKYRKAQQLETPMIDEAQLLEMITQESNEEDAPAQLTLPLD
jgi:DNA ligase (NAD+)